MKKKITITIAFIIFLISFKTNGQSLGSSLEFQSAITLSNDTTAVPPIGTVRTKSYTVPIGSVLKITGGRISSIHTGSVNGTANRTYKYISTLSIDGNVIFGQDQSAGISNVAGANGLTTLKISSEEAIWVPEGKVVILTTKVVDNIDINAIWNCWITGVIFKVVPN